MGTVNLSTELLRAFITVIEVASFTRAAEILGRTQPAVSLQVKRLEEAVGYSLIARKGKEISPTERGEALAIHARQILRLNDLAVSQFEQRDPETKLRVGLPVDYAVNTLQACLTDVVREFPETQIEIRCDLSKHLLTAMRGNEIDIAVALFDGDDQQFLFRNWKEQPTWVGANDFEIPEDADIPIVAHPYGCVYRDRMAAALKLAGKNWRIAYSSPGIGGVQRAVQDGPRAVLPDRANCPKRHADILGTGRPTGSGTIAHWAFRATGSIGRRWVRGHGRDDQDLGNAVF